MIEEMLRPGQGSVVKLFHAIQITTSVTGCSFLAKQEKVDAEVMNSHTRLTNQKLIIDYVLMEVNRRSRAVRQLLNANAHAYQDMH